MVIGSLTVWDAMTLILVGTVGVMLYMLRRVLKRSRDCVLCQAEWERKQQEWERQKAELTRQLREVREQVDMLLGKLREAMNRIAQLEAEQRNGHTEPDDALPALLIVEGPDPALQVDEPALRAVETRTGLHFSRLRDATLARLKSTLQRRRSMGRPFRFVHLAAHAGPEGVTLADGRATGMQLSEVLAGVQVLLVAGCSADDMGDLLGVVPTVVTLREGLAHDDARDMARVFWGAIGENLSGEQAYGRVRSLCPAVSEFVVIHQ